MSGQGTEVAIIGMAGRFPGASDVESLWRIIEEGRDSSTQLSESDLIDIGEPLKRIRPQNYVRRVFLLDDFDCFDANAFGISPTEAQIMDPHHRIFLQSVQTALESAGYDPFQFDGTVGIYGGMGPSTYFRGRVPTSLQEKVDGLQFLVANDKDYLTARVAYLLGLNGPCVTVQTACATSLTAAHLACRSLLEFECDLALAGGVSIRLPQRAGYVPKEGGILSNDGRCRAFDASSSGTAYGSGCGVVVLKRLDEALRDGDNVLAVVLSSAVSNDGANKVGFTAPGVDGHIRVIREAIEIADIDVSSIDYIETHGTGTQLGDPIEIAALAQTYGKSQTAIRLGSLKSNIGHLDAAAGVASLVKTILALCKRQLPRCANYSQPNPELKLSQTPFRIETEPVEWTESTSTPRRAAVCSLGMGGTNVHMIVQEAPCREVQSSSARPTQLIPISAASEDQLTLAQNQLADWLSDHPSTDLADVAFTLQVGRRVQAFRNVVVCDSVTDAIAKLTSPASPNKVDRPTEHVVYSLSQKDDVSLVADAHLMREPSIRQSLEEVQHASQAIGVSDWRDSERLLSFVSLWSLARLWDSWSVNASHFEADGTGVVAAKVLTGEFSLVDGVSRIVQGESFPPITCCAASPLRLAVAGIQPGGDAFDNLLNTLGVLWKSGLVVNWSMFNKGHSRRRIPLPTYPFKKQRFWIEPVKDLSESPAQIDPPRSSSPSSRERARDLDEEEPAELKVRVPAWQQECSNRWFALDLSDADTFEWFLVSPAENETLVSQIQELEVSATVLRSLDEEGLSRLSNSSVQKPLMIVFDWSREDFRSTDQGFVSLVRAAKALDGFSNQVRICVIASNTFKVVGTEACRPWNVLMEGVGRVLPQEDKRFRCVFVDVTDITTSDCCKRAIAIALNPPEDRVVAIRGTQVFRRSFFTIDGASNSNGEVFRREGAYLITGGFGTVGYSIAKYLAENFQARLLLASRHIADAEQRCEELALLGGQASAVVADVNNLDSLETAFSTGFSKYGSVDGVFHCAATPAGGFVQRKSIRSMLSVLEPKVTGALNVIKAARRFSAKDFVALFSSSVAIYGGIGAADYCAANAFLGALAERENQPADTPVCCIHWDAWQEESWLDEGLKQHPELLRELKQRRGTHGISTEEAIQMIEIAISGRFSQSLVTRQDPIQAAKWYDEALTRLGPSRDDEVSAVRPTPRLGTRQLSSTLCELYADTLSLDSILDDQDVFQLGMNSLLALDLVSRIRDTTQSDIPIGWVFEHRTVRDLCSQIEQNRIEKELALMDEIESMSAEDVQAELGSIEKKGSHR
ncbi:type I polyketide synthase [Blastopirellula retiformator]|uniref:Phthiocerol synthesis polyketide synthase type I PpsE n=1 Tax=Blastopirellula retiformator TaxID=2527970 RepID=A0A5C5VMI9_9BACT|nr:type I polyketide synthase [Blastopirellula retiformator]TWT38929.1 Phthiocerol synthesis polyketide synthase type I PpsE [Blastopirellula retiformator]